MREIPKKNYIVGGLMAGFSAACFAGAAFFFARSSQQHGLVALYIVLAMQQAGLGTFLLMKSRKP